MQSPTRALQEKGLKATPQRVELYTALLSTKAHPSVETLYKTVKEVLPTISLNTVYTTLCAFEDAGLARRIDAGDGLRYDGNSTPHSHIVCNSCHRVEDLAAQVDTNTIDLLHQVATASGYLAQDYAVYFFGICPVCQKEI